MTFVDERPEAVQPSITDWVHLGFDGSTARHWQTTGWHDPLEADEWRRVPGGVDPAQLRALHDAGYSPDQIDRVVRWAGGQVVPWTRVLADASPLEPDSHRSREGAALFLLDLLATTETD